MEDTKDTQQSEAAQPKKDTQPQKPQGRTDKKHKAPVPVGTSGSLFRCDS